MSWEESADLLEARERGVEERIMRCGRFLNHRTAPIARVPEPDEEGRCG